jgi:hypothetical protein
MDTSNTQIHDRSLEWLLVMRVVLIPRNVWKTVYLSLKEYTGKKNPLELVQFSRIPIGMHKHSTNIVIISEIIVSFVVGKYLIHIQSKNKFINTYKI